MARDLKLQVILDAADKATAPLRKITQGSGKTAEALRASREQLRDLNRQQKDVSAYRQARWAMRSNQRAIDETTRKQREYSEALEQQRESHVNIKASLTSARRQYDRLAKQVAEATEPNQQLSGELEKARIQLTSQQQAFDKSSRAIKQYRDRSRHAEDQVKQLNGTQRAHQDRLRGIQRRLEEAGVSTDDMARAARDLRGQEERLNDTLERQKRRLERIKDVRERMSRIRGRGASVLDNGRSLAAGAGVAGGVATAAVGGLGHNFATNGEEVRQWAARLGLATEQLSRLQYAGSQFGVEGEAMIDALKELSLRTDEFTTTGKGGGAEAFQRLGLSAEQLDAASNDTGQLFDLVLGRLREVENVAARQRIVDELFGGQGGEQMAELAGASADEIRRLIDEADALGVTLGSQDAEAAQEYMRAWRGATGALQGVRNILGRELAPELADLFRQFSDWVRNNRDQVQQFARDFRSGLREVLPLIVDTVKGMAEFARTSAAIVQRVAEMVGGFDNLAIIMSTLFASKTIGSALSLATAVAGLAGGGKAMAGLGKAMKWTGQQAKGPLTGALRGLGALLAGTWRHVASFARGLRAFGAIAFAVGRGLIQSLVQTAIPMIGNALLWLGRTFLTVGRFFLLNPIGLAITAIAGGAYLIYRYWEPIKAFFGNLLSGAANRLSAAWDAIKTAFSGGIGGVTQLLANWSPLGILWRGISTALGTLGIELPTTLTDLGGSIIDGLIGGLTGKLSSLRDRVTGLADSVKGWFADVLDINSPSRVFAQLGGYTVDGLNAGLDAQRDEPARRVRDIAKRVSRAGAGLALGAASLPAAAMPAIAPPEPIQFDTRPPLSRAEPQAQGGLTLGDININVNATPGMDERQVGQLVAQEVQRALAEAERSAAARRRSSLRDID